MSEYKLNIGFINYELPKEVGHYIDKIESKLQQATQDLETLKASVSKAKELIETKGYSEQVWLALDLALDEKGVRK